MYFSLLTRHFLQPGIQHNTRNSLFRVPTTVAFYSRLHHGLGLRSLSSIALQTTKRTGPTGTQDKTNFSSFVKAASVVGVGLGLSTLHRPPIHCDGKFGIGWYIHPKLYQFSRTQNERSQPNRNQYTCRQAPSACLIRLFVSTGLWNCCWAMRRSLR